MLIKTKIKLKIKKKKKIRILNELNDMNGKLTVPTSYNQHTFLKIKNLVKFL